MFQQRQTFKRGSPHLTGSHLFHAESVVTSINHRFATSRCQFNRDFGEGPRRK
ncbi:hypothetical protein XCR_2767 [Xanthomonas campestris pv. raphani 756C]|nr:hypothetical protein XCR_2767 [Xanthomonas campestris pv. raphani 756C]